MTLEHLPVGVAAWVIATLATRRTCDVYLLSNFPPARVLRRLVRLGIGDDSFLLCRECVGQWIAWSWLLLLCASAWCFPYYAPVVWIFAGGLAAQAVALELPPVAYIRPDTDDDEVPARVDVNSVAETSA